MEKIYCIPFRIKDKTRTIAITTATQYSTRQRGPTRKGKKK